MDPAFNGGIPDYGAQLAQIQQQQAVLDAKQKMYTTLTAPHGPGVINYAPNGFENAAGVNPPSFEGSRDAQTGALLDQYKLDPYGGEALQNLKTQAFSTGLSPMAQIQMQQQQREQQTQSGAVGKQQMTATDTAQSNLARSGGLTGGAAAMLQRGGARDALNAQQGVSGAGVTQRLGIQQQDIANKNALLGQFGDLETQANKSNITESENDLTRKAAFDANRYNQQMSAWGASQSADATRSAGGGGKK